jgi:hypothetical protein
MTLYNGQSPQQAARYQILFWAVSLGYLSLWSVARRRTRPCLAACFLLRRSSAISIIPSKKLCMFVIHICMRSRKEWDGTVTRQYLALQVGNMKTPCKKSTLPCLESKRGTDLMINAPICYPFPFVDVLVVGTVGTVGTGVGSVCMVVVDSVGGVTT